MCGSLDFPDSLLSKQFVSLSEDKLKVFKELTHSWLQYRWSLDKTVPLNGWKFASSNQKNHPDLGSNVISREFLHSFLSCGNVRSFLTSAVFHLPWTSCGHVIRTLGEESYCLSAKMLCCWCGACEVSCCPPASVSRLVLCYCVWLCRLCMVPFHPISWPLLVKEFEVWVRVACMPRSLARALPFSTILVGNNTQGHPLVTSLNVSKSNSGNTC